MGGGLGERYPIISPSASYKAGLEAAASEENGIVKKKNGKAPPATEMSQKNCGMLLFAA